MNFLTIGEIAKKLEKWADQKMPHLAPGAKLRVTVRLNRLLSDQLDELIASLRLEGKVESAKIVQQTYAKLQNAAKRATLDLVKRIVEFKIDRLNKQHNEVSALDILDPNFKMSTNKPWKDNEIPTTVHFDECAQRARQLAQTLRQVAAKAELIDAPSPKSPVSSKRWKIASWLWKLYEKTLKVIVDAILERAWPK